MSNDDRTLSRETVMPAEHTSLIPNSDRTPLSANAIQPHDRLLLEAQRDSAAFDLGVYLNLRQGIWSNIVREVEKGNRTALVGNLAKLSDDVWRFIANKDQVQSDLTILLEMLRNCAHKGRERLAWASVCSFMMAILVVARKDPHFERYYHIWNPALCILLGISGSITAYYGVGLVLLESKKNIVESLQILIEGEQARESDRGALSGWSWLLLQFTSLV